MTVELLAERGIPVIIQTGVGLPRNLVDRFPQMPIHIKPCVAANLIKQLDGMISVRERTLERPLVSYAGEIRPPGPA